MDAKLYTIVRRSLGIVLLLGLLGLAVLSLSFGEPLLELARAHKFWFGVIFFLTVGSLVLIFDPNLRRERKYKAEIARRSPVTDQELFRQYFTANEVAPDVPGRVRRLVAESIGYPVEKILPDDCFDFIFYDVDTIDLIKDLEEEFEIKFTDDVLEHTLPTLRGIIMSVEQTRRGQEASSGDSASPAPASLNHEGPLADDNPYTPPQTPLAKAKWELRRPRNLPPWLSALALAALAAIPIAIALWVGH